MRRVRASCSDPGDAALVDLYRDHSVAPLVDLRRRLRAVLDVVSRGLELTRQWDSKVAITADAVVRVAGLGLADMEASVVDLHQGLDGFLLFVIGGIRLFWGGRLGFGRILLHILIGGFGLILFLLPLFLQCDPGDTVGGSGVIADPALIDANFREAWMPYLSRSSRGSADLDDFSEEVGGGWLPVLDIFHLPPLTGDVLVDVVRKKKSSAGGLDGWGWKELKALHLHGLMVLLVFFDWLRRLVFGLTVCLMLMLL